MYIVDDESHARENLKRKIESLGYDIVFCGEADSVESAAKDIASMKIDLLFLDIEMPEEDGFALLDRFDDLSFMVIFVTAYNDFALKAFEYFTLGYVMKPIDKEMLDKAIKKAFAYKGQEQGRVRDAMEYIKHGDVDKVVIPSATGFIVLPAPIVISIETGEGYTNICCTDGKTHLSTKRLKEYEEVLKDIGFLRVHRGFLINCQHIVSFDKNGILLLSNHKAIKINKNKRKSVADSIREYCKANQKS